MGARCVHACVSARTCSTLALGACQWWFLLPLKVQLDPVDRLQERLDQLEAYPEAAGIETEDLETEALRSALELIQIARSLRLTSTPAARTAPLVAGL